MKKLLISLLTVMLTLGNGMLFVHGEEEPIVGANTIVHNIETGQMTRSTADPDKYPPLLGKGTTYKTIAAAAKKVRSQLVARKTTISIHLKNKSYTKSKSAMVNTAVKVLDEAFKHTGKAREGDYLLMQYNGASYSYYGNKRGQLNLTFYVRFRTTASQEKYVNSRVTSLLKSMKISNLTASQKTKKIYNYITSHISYDYSSSGEGKHTAYNGLKYGTCVCQGYALLFYRMALQAKVDARYIRGYSNSSGENHGWNIVKLNGKYYNLDATWDAGYSADSWRYFLKSNSGFTGHTRRSQYNTSSFNKKYKMATSNYKMVTSVTLNKTSHSIKPKKKFTLKATIKNSSSPDKKSLKWTSSNKKVATVSSKGVVTTKALGKATITAKVGNIKATCKVTVTNNPAKNLSSAATVTLSGTSFAYSGSKISPAVTVTYNGATLTNGTDYTVSYSNNLLPGTATVKVTYMGKYTGTTKKTYKIYVPRPTNDGGFTYPTDSTDPTHFIYRFQLVNGATGYQLYAATSSTIIESYANQYTLSYLQENGFTSDNVAAFAWKLENLTSTTYFAVRSYIVIDGVTYFSSWTPLTTYQP